MATTPNRSWPTPEDTDLVRDGAAAIRALGDAIDGSVGQGFVYAGTRYYTSSGVFLKDDPLLSGDIGLRAVRVTVVGGGGGGGATNATAANQLAAGRGGPAGGYAQKFYGPSDVAAFDASISVTRGGGGSGGDGTSGSPSVRDGNAGGTSSFLSLSATGGGAGGRGEAADAVPRVADSAGNAGIGSGGDLNAAGGEGGNGFRLALTFQGGVGGKGGDSVFGGGGKSTRYDTNNSMNGNPGRSPGAGGSGAAAGQNQSATFGGNGADGIVIVDCFV